MGLLRLIGGLCRRRDRREIFAYHDGVRRRYADPIVVWRAIESDPEFDPTRHFGEMDRGDGEAFQVATRMVRRVFDLPAFDTATGRGLTEFQVTKLLWDFIAYTEAVKKNIGPPPTAPSPTEPAASPTTAPEGTSDSLASG